MTHFGRLGLVVVLVFLMQAVRSFVPEGDGTSHAASVTLSVGFGILVAFFLGEIAAGIRFPRLTGYLVAGVAVGPRALDLINVATLADLSLVNGAAVALIALSAGAEMDFRSMRPVMKAVTWISIVAVFGTSVGLVALIFGIRPLLDFMDGFSTEQQLGAALVIGIAASAQSPAVAVAVKAETGANGPVARTVIATVVAADLMVIVLFAVASSIARAAFGGDAGAGATTAKVAWELFGSLGAGAIVGLALSAFLRNVKQGRTLFIIALAVVIAEIGDRLHLDELLTALSAGMVAENVGRRGKDVLETVAGASLPVFVLFFLVAGASIDLPSIPAVALPVLIIVVVRAAGFLGGSVIAGRIAGAPDAVRKYAGFGLLPQAGLAIALALLVQRNFPELGSGAVVIFGVVAINELVAPVLFRWSLVAAGEAESSPAVTATRGSPEESGG